MMYDNLEIWVDVIGYENIYKISTFGNVKSIRRNIIISPCFDSDGYVIYRFNVNGSTKAISLHRLMAMHFIPNPNNYKIVNHIDGNKLNNNIENLEWCTSLYNNYHAVKIGLRCNDTLGNPKEVAQIKNNKIINVFYSASEASRITKIHRGTICDVCRGNGKSAGGYEWKYTNQINQPPLALIENKCA